MSGSRNSHRTLHSPQGDDRPNPTRTSLQPPKSVRILRVLGAGRAAEAVLVEAVMPDGSKQVCVEKVFKAGWLTRTIYRLSFQAPFAYQSNRDAILTCFYRRRVAAAVLAASGTGVQIATPLYVRFDEASGAWVLAAKWIDGRGIKPAPADRYRLRRRLSLWKGSVPGNTENEIDNLIGTMHQLESLFNDCGLVGSGWQVAPRAMVSTANLLREQDHYTVIDLESGIPAVLVPKYLLSGARRAELPPFDDLDEDKLRSWLKDNARRLQQNLGADGLATLHADVEMLIEHSSHWKAAELALFRRPWRLLRRDGMLAYQQECVRRWEQERTIDAETAVALPNQRWKSRLIWCLEGIPGKLGRFASRLVGNRDDRRRWARCLRSEDFRRAQLHALIRDREAKWIESQRLRPDTRLTATSWMLHGLLQSFTPVAVHRFLADSELRSKRRRQMALLLLSSDYQSWFGRTRIEAAIESWRQSKRISNQEAQDLRRQLSGSEVRAYLRVLGAHLALKTFTPIVAPAKYGGIAAFLAGGNLWFLLPMLLMPALRTFVTLASWWSTREEGIPHREAILAGLLPTIGSIAFPLQMYAARSELSIFLIRDAAAKFGRNLPIYGGPNSRTEIAMIRSADALIELLDTVSTATARLHSGRQPWERQEEAMIDSLPSRNPLGRWLDQLAIEQIAEHDSGRAERRTERRTEQRSERREQVADWTAGHLEAA